MGIGLEFGGRAVDVWSELPLFPLNTVLFPGMVLPLRIFEERYKLMINRCLEEKRPFGVLLIREGREVGGGAVPYEVGTTAAIAGASRSADGQMHIATIGSDRFRLHDLWHDRPYLVGSAEPWPLTGGHTEQALGMVQSVQTLFQDYLGLLAQAQGDEVAIEEVPDDPRSLALLVAIALNLPMSQKQHLLAQPTVAQMLGTERAILRREQLLLDYIIHTQSEQWEGGYSGLLAKN
jgi:Lon protease-like protein